MPLVPTQSPDAEFLSQLDWQSVDATNRARFWYDGVYYQIDWSNDEEFGFATEWLGQYTDTDDQDVIGDRKNGVLYGASVDHTRKFNDELEAEGFYDELRQDNEVRKIDDEYIDQDDEDLWEVTWSERQILSEDGPSNYERRTFRFWKPVEDKTGDVLTEEEIGGLVQDWNRMERYGEGWITVHINIDIYRGDPDDWEGEPVGSASLGGVDREIGYGDDNSYFYDAMAEVAGEAAYGVLVEQPEQLGREGWPKELVLLRYLFAWLSRFCNFVGAIDPASIEVISAGIGEGPPRMTTYLADVQVVCNIPMQELQRVIQERLIPELEAWSMNAFTEVRTVNDEQVLNLVVTEWPFSEIRTQRHILSMNVSEGGAAGPAPSAEPIIRSRPIEWQMRRRGYFSSPSEESD